MKTEINVRNFNHVEAIEKFGRRNHIRHRNAHFGNDGVGTRQIEIA